jgi:hypothetical protein
VHLDDLAQAARPQDVDRRATRRVLTQVLYLFRRADALTLRPLTFGVARP